MTRLQLLRLQLRHLRLSAWDKIIDFANLALPIFVTVGIMAGAARFWFWVFWR